MYPYGIVVKVDLIPRIINFDITEDGKKMKLGEVFKIDDPFAYSDLNKNMLAVVKIDTGDSWIADMNNLSFIDLYTVKLYNMYEKESGAAKFVIDFYQDKKIQDGFAKAMVNALEKLHNECCQERKIQ